MADKDKLPEGWQWARLEEVCDVDKSIIQGIDSDLPFLGLEMIESKTGSIDLTARTVNPHFLDIDVLAFFRSFLNP